MLSESHFGSSYCTFSKCQKVQSKSQNERKRPELFVILVPDICTCVECTERYVRIVETFCHKVGIYIEAPPSLNALMLSYGIGREEEKERKDFSGIPTREQ